MGPSDKNYDGLLLLATVMELAELIKRLVGFEGSFSPNPTKPDRTPRKLLDVSCLHALGWRHRTSLEEGIASTYELYREQVAAAAQFGPNRPFLDA